MWLFKLLRRAILHARRCIANIRDDCAHDYAGCWRGDFNVNGKSQTFHACKDNIELYKVRTYQTPLCHLYNTSTCSSAPLSSLRTSYLRAPVGQTSL